VPVWTSNSNEQITIEQSVDRLISIKRHSSTTVTVGKIIRLDHIGFQPLSLFFSNKPTDDAAVMARHADCLNFELLVLPCYQQF
jgi:hypothetical protein